MCVLSGTIIHNVLLSFLSFLLCIGFLVRLVGRCLLQKNAFFLEVFLRKATFEIRCAEIELSYNAIIPNIRSKLLTKKNWL